MVYYTPVQLGTHVQLGQLLAQLGLFLAPPSLSSLSAQGVQLGVSNCLFSTVPQLGTAQYLSGAGPLLILIIPGTLMFNIGALTYLATAQVLVGDCLAL